MENLLKAIKNKNVILFVGAGVSINLGLPSWGKLISQTAKELGYDSDVFKSLGDYLSLAEFYKIKKGSISSLCSWMDKEWHDTRIEIKDSTVHKMIVDLDIPIIYTTNYDRWLEKAFDCYNKPYTKIANVGDLLKIQNNTTQIIKLHGDFNDENSIVLTETSYFDRLSLDSPMDIKLRSDILGKSILFIGYSLEDINIRYMLYKLNRLWDLSEHSEIRPKSYIFLSSPNTVQMEVMKSRNITPFISDNDDIGKGLEKFLEQLIEGVSRI